jgi:hypothetical protein
LCGVVSDADIGKHKSRAHGRRDRIARATVAEAIGQNANYHLCIKGLLPYIEVIILRTNYEGTGEGCRCVQEFSNFEVVGGSHF